jgi:hypothetical protein
MKTRTLISHRLHRATLRAAGIAVLATLASCAAPHHERVRGYENFHSSRRSPLEGKQWYPGWAANADYKLPPEPGEDRSRGLQAYKLALETIRLPFKVLVFGTSFYPPVP